MVRAMTTLKPQLVRADTLDLQDHDAPSAKDHTRQVHPNPYGYGPAAPHQAKTLRHAAEDEYQQQQTSPRVSEDQHHGGPFSDNQRFYDDPDDEIDDQHMNHLHGPNGTDTNNRDYDEDGDASDSHDEDMDDDLMDKISSSPSIEDEDIDFEFVYALHTFVATVEGQANATKGDTMVLLDDSNSYWWLVRVVKDGSIGYLPAEHIETPTERLARLNKHRNIDLSASMLGDNPEKPKNPLKKAMRRRNAKTVQFTAPTYYEPSDYEGSDDEEGEDSQVDGGESVVKSQQTAQAQDQQTDSRGPERERQGPAVTNGIIKRVSSNDSLSDEPSSPIKAQVPEPLQPGVSHQDSVSRSRKGNLRNTDSFFKDDTVETKKISLTPRLLRGDSDSNAAAVDPEAQRGSMETFDKLLGSEEKPKEDKKKEKKGMLSGLFKRKDKAPKGSKADQETAGKISEESMRHSPQSKDSLESLTKTDVAPERKPSKLQKTPPSFNSPKSSPTEARAPQSQYQQQAEVQDQTSGPPAPTAPAPAPPTLRQVSSIDTSVGREDQKPQTQPQSQTPGRFPSLQEKRSIFSPITSALKSSQSTTSPDTEPNVKPVYSKRAKERFAIETSDSDDDPTPTAGSQVQDDSRGISPLNENQVIHRRNDSGMQISPIESSADDGSFDGRASKGLSSKHSEYQEAAEAPTPLQNTEVTPIEETEHTASTSKPSPSTATTHTPSTSRSTPTWSDASLRTYMENDQDIKDLLIIVHDKSNVTPVSSDHPLMTSLFSNERTKLAEMQTQLDSMLMTWMGRKNASVM